MNLASVDKLAKDNNGVKYLPVRQNLFDRIVDAEGKKTKTSKETVRAFCLSIQKRIVPKKFEWTREQKLQKSLKYYAELKEYKIPRQ